ncbi:response regulator [Collimonas antrihumi]|uniref:response regulator n=1 Tax=Collimonas antrihumi TaxID=1940615 RepID=UPI001B8ABBB0|nr:response regulator [Collimonas antrihumi]
MNTIAELSILIVEDHPLQQKLLVEQLHRWGCNSVAVANDGVEAMRVLARSPVDVVVCDINMPNMNGPRFAVAQGELARSTGQALPMLVWMSSEDRNVLDLHIMLAREAGFPGVCAYSKPPTASSVLHILKDALSFKDGGVM